MSFNIEQIPFSRFGSYLSVSYLKNKKGLVEGLYLRNIRNGDDDDGEVFKLDVIQNSNPVSFEIILKPTSLELRSDKGYVKLIYPEAEYIQFHGENVGLRLTLVANAYDTAFWYKDEQWQVNAFSKSLRFMLTPKLGRLDMDLSWNVNRCTHVQADFLPDEDDSIVAGLIEEFFTVYSPNDYNLTFEEAEKKVRNNYEQWLKNTLTVSDKYSKAKQLASYITWSSIVKEEGFLPRKAMYMSKNWMTNIWSWDHCFNAMALHQYNPDLAWDQLMIFFDVQDESGVLPDYMNNEFAYWNCCKPPIHGWALLWMMKRSTISLDRVSEIYDPLVKWTNYFTQHCDLFENGIPEYYHGNDSGWDNSTVFKEGVPVESPDLCAFLILQMETLALLADKLDMEDDVKHWDSYSKLMLDNLLTYFWNGKQFVAKHSGKVIERGDSLLLFMPIVLGKRLPENIRVELISALKDKERFLTDHGLATESINSPYYVDDGYWRGPIWAPTTMLLIDGLHNVGEKEFASKLAGRFCDMAQKNGMAENYDAKTGNGLRDRAFTWTSSVFLILANEYVTGEGDIYDYEK